MYKPKPVDTTGVTLTDDIVALTEFMAKNTHEVWAKARIQEGWHYGTERDDVLMIHPGLVPYEQLSEGEKSYDRNTAIETLKLLIKLGYRIEKEEGRS